MPEYVFITFHLFTNLFFFITKTIFKPLTHQRILITWQNYTIYLEERSLHSTDSQRHDKSGLKSQQHCELCGLCLFLFTCLPPYAFPFVCLHFYMHHGSLACFPDPLPWCHQETRVPTITSPTLRLSVSLEEGARRGAGAGGGGVLKGDHVCLTGVFLWMISLRLPRCWLKWIVQAAALRTAASDTHCVKSVCVSLGDWLWVFVSVHGWGLWYF